MIILSFNYRVVYEGHPFFSVGILEKEQEQLVVYGSIDFGKTVLTDKRYEELLSKTAKQLKIKPHK